MANIIKIHNRRLNKKLLIVIVAIVMVIIAGVVTWFFVSENGQKMIQSSNNQKESESSELDAQLAVDKVNELDVEIGLQHSDEELKNYHDKLRGYINNASSVEEKQVYLDSSFSMYLSDGDGNSALEVAKESESLNATALTASSMAEAYMSLGNYSKAAEYFQLAADRSEKTDNPNLNCPYNDFLYMKSKAEALIK